MKTIVKEAIEATLKYIDEMDFETSETTARIAGKLGFNLSTEDLFDIECEVYEEVDRSRQYILDKSHHDGLVEGLPFNLDFVKRRKL